LTINFLKKLNLFGNRKFAMAAAGSVQAESATIIRTPLAEGAIRAGVFFCGFITHQ